MKDLRDILDKLYQPVGWNIQDFKIEPESVDYAACHFKYNNFKALFRIGKTTPKKVGQFVVLWKRASNGLTEPFSLNDSIDFFVVTVIASNRRGQFVFPKKILYEKGILSGENSEGKRGIRVYPVWDITTNRQAKNTQAWQLDYFFEYTASQVENSLNIQRLYKS